MKFVRNKEITNFN